MGEAGDWGVHCDTVNPKIVRDAEPLSDQFLVSILVIVELPLE
jgi:hypothetical protein